LRNYIHTYTRFARGRYDPPPLVGGDKSLLF
jgi:hypothetical protein